MDTRPEQWPVLGTNTEKSPQVNATLLEVSIESQILLGFNHAIFTMFIFLLEYCLGEEPEAEMSCFEPCAGDCEVTAWSKWSRCPESCSDSENEYYQNRYRELLHGGRVHIR